MKPQILVVDDEKNIRTVLAAILKREGYDVFTATDGGDAIAQLKDNQIATLITDLKMPQIDGLELLEYVKRNYADIPVIMITAHGTIDTAVNALKLGAFDYITKPLELAEFKVIVQKAIKTYQLNCNEALVPETPTRDGGRFGIIGTSNEIKQVFTIIEKVADTPSTVLITGESGTGKELVAQALHHQSSRKAKPFIKINCAAIPKTLMESELFGYEKGAFTGAVTSKPGRFELADRGTLFLDEIGEIPVEMQVKLLRAIQENEFEKVGGIKTMAVNVRLVSATNQDLLELTKAGRFREDLYYRLNVVPIHLPALRERPQDIPQLATYFISKYNEKLKKQIEGIDTEAQHILQNYAWPGNIRELENTIERLILFVDNPVITAQDIPVEMQQVKSLPVAVPTNRQGTTSLKEIVRETTEKVEKEVIVQALRETGGNVTKAAQKLMISRKSLQNKMKEFNLRDIEF